MNETVTDMQNKAADAIKAGSETAYANGKAALDQVTTKSKEAIEQGMKSIDEVTTMARGNVEALLASTRAATTGLESIAHMVADFSRKSFEETTAAARAMTTVKTPNELLQLQNDFAKTQFDAAITEMSKLSETLVKLAGEVFEPVQNRVAVATDKIKTAAATTFNR
jgi:phasin family protein